MRKESLYHVYISETATSLIVKAKNKKDVIPTMKRSRKFDRYFFDDLYSYDITVELIPSREKVIYV